MNLIWNKISREGHLMAYYTHAVVLPPGPFKADELEDLIKRYRALPYFLIKDVSQSAEEFMDWVLSSRFA
jgi:hypothetical protein